MYIPQDFELYEVLPEFEYRAMYPVKGELLWRMFPYELLWTAQQLRFLYGKIYINTWYFHEGGSQDCGYRDINCNTGADLSDHKWFRALDLTFLEYDTDKVRQDILNNQWQPPFKYIRGVELGTPHLHMGLPNHDKEKYGILEIPIP